MQHNATYATNKQMQTSDADANDDAADDAADVYGNFPLIKFWGPNFQLEAFGPLDFGFCALTQITQIQNSPKNPKK